MIDCCNASGTALRWMSKPIVSENVSRGNWRGEYIKNSERLPLWMIFPCGMNLGLSARCLYRLSLLKKIVSIQLH